MTVGHQQRFSRASRVLKDLPDREDRERVFLPEYVEMPFRVVKERRIGCTAEE